MTNTSPIDVGLERLNDLRFELLRERFRAMERRPESLEVAIADVQRLQLPSLATLTEDQKTDGLYRAYDDILARNEPRAEEEERKATADALRMRVPDDMMRFCVTGVLEHYGLRPGHPLQTTGRELMVDRLVLADGALEAWFPFELVATEMAPPPEPEVTDVVLTTPTSETFDEVPTGTADDVLEWVDGDGDRARLAARAEAVRRGAKSRKTLMKKLTAISEKHPGEMEPEPNAPPPELTVIDGGEADGVTISNGYRYVVAIGPDDTVTHCGLVAAELVDGLWS